jgi:hypothetical protein
MAVELPLLRASTSEMYLSSMFNRRAPTTDGVLAAIAILAGQGRRAAGRQA